MIQPSEPRDLNQLDDDQLVTLSLDGRLDAFNILALRHQSLVRVICVGTVGTADADDLMQETLVKAWQRLDMYTQRGKFKAWISAVARNACLDQLRRRKRQPTSSLDQLIEAQGDYFAPESGERSPDEHMLNLELGEELREAFDSLPQEQRLAIYHREIAGLEYREIADATGWSMGTVKSRISRGRAAMREHIINRRAMEQAHDDQ